MKTYLVGGAVRDQLLGLPAGDRDYVVVGESPESMLAAGFKPVGADFPVFLHPDTGEEYALARTERKTAPGYKGFVFHADASVTLVQDLARRDFTLNAIAQDASSTCIDPYHGQQDIECKIIRHVSPAFGEDPLRVLRGARFMARFSHLGFRVADDTLQLMRAMAHHGELDHLVPERIWQELRAALQCASPSAFIQTLRSADALGILLPEVAALYGVPQRIEYHPEIDAGRHTEMVCDMAARLAPGDAVIGFAALLHDVGKALTDKTNWPKHTAHEHLGISAIEAICVRFKVPHAHRTLAVHACREHLLVHRLHELHPKTVFDLLQRIDAFRHPERVRQLAIVCEADKRGRLGLTETSYPNGPLLQQYFDAAKAVKAAQLTTHVKGPALGKVLQSTRIAAIAYIKNSRL
jgi:tRNA nucleotidyltransferase (CCA-adding enzyme)